MGTLLLRFQQLRNGLPSLNVAVPALKMIHLKDVQKNATTPEIIEQVHDMVLDDRRMKVREIAEITRRWRGPEGDQGSSVGYYTYRWSRKGRRSCRQLARPCSWRKCGNPMQRVRAGTTPRPCLCTRMLCSWTPATTSCTQIALQPSSRWGSLPRHCKMPSAPASSTASGPRYKNTNPAMHISLLHV